MRCEGRTSEGRCHNITSAKLYNCLHQRRCPARNSGEAQGKVATRKCHTCKHLYNFRYVKEAATFPVRRFSLRTPGRGGGRRGPGGSGRVAPGPLPAPPRAPQLGPQFPQLLRSGAVPHQRHQDSTGISRNHLSAPRASCRLTRLRCWVVPGRDSSSSASSVRRAPSLHSAVEFNLAAIPPGLASLRLRKCQVAFVQQSCPATSPLSCLQLAKPSGRPGYGPPGRWRRECRSAHALCGSQDCQPCLHASHTARHPLRGSARINGVGEVLLFEG